RIDKPVLAQQLVAPLVQRQDRDAAMRCGIGSISVEDTVKLGPAGVGSAIGDCLVLAACDGGLHAQRQDRVDVAFEERHPMLAAGCVLGQIPTACNIAARVRQFDERRDGRRSVASGFMHHQALPTESPPSTKIDWPVIYDPASLHSSSATPAMSSGSPMRPRGMR